MKLRIFKVEFDGMWPVPHGLIILAESYDQAFEIAKKTVTHTEVISVDEVLMDKPGVVFYESGDY